MEDYFQQKFNINPTNELEIKSVIGLLKQKNSVGIDEFPI